MNVETLSERLTSSLPALFVCSQIDSGGVLVRTPLLFPDGDMIDVVVLESSGHFIVTDSGDAIGWLWLQTARHDQSPRQRELIADACQTLGAELDGGQLIIHDVAVADLADAIVRLAQAEARVADTLRLVEPGYARLAAYLEGEDSRGYPHTNTSPKGGRPHAYSAAGAPLGELPVLAGTPFGGPPRPAGEPPGGPPCPPGA